MGNPFFCSKLRNQKIYVNKQNKIFLKNFIMKLLPLLFASAFAGYDFATNKYEFSKEFETLKEFDVCFKNADCRKELLENKEKFTIFGQLKELKNKYVVPEQCTPMTWTTYQEEPTYTEDPNQGLTSEEIQKIIANISVDNAKKYKDLSKPDILNLEKLAAKYNDKLADKFKSIKVLKKFKNFMR